jgi:hypothetical protein
MAKTVEDRYGSAAEVQQDLERALASPGIDARSVATVALRRPGAAARAAGEAPTLLLASGIARANVPAAAAVAAAAANAATDPAISAADRSVSDAVASTSAEDSDLDRLRRSDVDEYEWTLRRQRWLRRLAMPLVGLLVVGAAAFLVIRRPWERVPDGVEHEPNNTPGYANLLVAGADARHDRRAAERSRERRRLLPRAGGQGAARAARAARGDPGVDLVLELFDAQGRRIAKSDARGRGLGEWLQPTRSDRRRRTWPCARSGSTGRRRPPTRWILHADRALGPAAARWELEPNDWPAAATPLRRRARARLPRQRRGPRLVLDHAGEDGTGDGHVNAPAGVDVIVFRDEDAQEGRQQARRGRRRAVRAGRRSGQAAVHRHRAQARTGRRTSRTRRCRVWTILTS